MSTKKFVAKHGLDNNNQTITNVANPINGSDAVNKNVSDVIYDRANTAYGQANTATTNAATAYGQANTATTNAATAYGQANTALDTAQSAYGQANTALDTAQSAYGQANTALGTAQSAYNNSNTKFSSSGGTITGPVEISSSLLVTGNVTFSGHVTTVSANNIVSKDNMIYLNEGTSGNTNPDIGIAGAYYDTEYHHCGFFRDASDGIWKVFDNYKPEPDASVYIDTSNSTFRIADFQANNITANTLSGTANNANYFGGYAPSYYTDASNLSSGTVPNVRLSNIPNSSIANTSITINGTAISLGGSATVTTAAGTLTGNTLNSTVLTSSLTSVGTITSGTWSGSFGVVSGANLTNLNANNISSGTVSTARLGSGVANSSAYLAGDNTWKAINQFVSISDIGLSANQIPINQYLGSMAYQDSSSISVTDISVSGNISSTGTLFASNVKTSGLYDNSNRRLIIEDANGAIVWG